MSKIIVLANGQQVAIDNIDINLPDNLIDAFARLRVSTPVIQTVINQSSPLRALTLTEGQVSGTNTSSSFNSSRASTTLSVSTTVGLRRLRSNICGIYQPGKSLLILFTFIFGENQSNVKKRVGYFDPNDGIFLQQNGSSLEWVKRSSVSGSIVETATSQASWNKDIFNGTQNGYNFDITKGHIGFISIEWLGTGNVCCGFFKDQKPVIANVFEHTNLTESVYMRTANLFLTYEIERTVTGGTGNTNFECICGSIINEGAIDQIGRSLSINRQAVFTTTQANLIKSIILFRLNPNNINSRILPIGLEIAITSNTNFYIYLLRNPTYTSIVTPTWISLPNSSLQYDINPSVTPSVNNFPDCVVWTGTGTATQDINISGFNLNNYLGSSFNGTPEEWALAVQCDTSNEVVSLAVIKFLEMI